MSFRLSFTASVSKIPYDNSDCFSSNIRSLQTYVSGILNESETQLREVKRNNKTTIIIFPKIVSLLGRFKQDNKEKTPYKLDGYGLEIFKTAYNDFGGGYINFRTPNKNEFVELYTDAKYFMSLTYEGKNVAFIGFIIDEEGNILVKQIQGAKFVHYDGKKDTKIPHNNYLKGFEWKRLLLTALEEYISRNGFTGTIEVQSARNNSWPDISSHEKPGGKGYKAYDQIALDNGYIGGKRKNYKKKMTPLTTD